MSYEVLARKWRPQQFNDVVGQDHVVQTLKNAITSDRIAHAYLFVGPRGIGKTSIARIFAKALNCAEGPSVNPCGKCDACVEIVGGTSMDVLEIDGASNNGVEQVRDLRETVKYAPTRGKFKIYIIDEVHMLSVAAFNALLKTLEEPPPHVKFVFATTEAEKILATIVSRCQRFDLRRIPVGMIIERLKLIAGDEKIDISNDALLAIARGSEGGLRDAESALDQLISFKGKKIAEEDVLSVFGLVSRETLETLAGRILGGDIKEVIKIISDLDNAGKDLQRLVLELMEHFRNLLVCMHVDDAGGSLDLTDGQVAALKEQAGMTNTARVLRITGILSEVENRMRYALSRRTLLETALIRCARAAVVVSLEEILSKLNDLKKNVSNSKDRIRGSGFGVRDKKREEKSTIETTPSEPKSASAQPEPKPASDPAPPGDALDFLVGKWHDIVEEVGKIAPLARSVLVDASPLSVEDDRVVVGFDPEFAEEIDNFSKSSRNRKAVERIIKSLLRRDITVDFVVGGGGSASAQGYGGTSRTTDDGRRKADDRRQTTDDGQQKEESNSDSPPCVATRAERGELADDEGKQEEKTDKKEKKPKKDMRQWAQEPAVAKVLDMFNGSVMDVRE